MKILFINQCYWPDDAATSQILTDLAEELAFRGHEITVICSRRPYSGKSRTYPEKEFHNDVMVYRIACPGWGKKGGLLGRFVDSLFYFVGSLFKSLMLTKQDVVITLSSPPLIGVMGRLNQLFRNTPHVHWCMDIFPDNAVEFGVIHRNGLLHKALAAISSFYLCSADIVAVLSKYMAERIMRYGVNQDSFCIVPVWADGEKIKPIEKRSNWFVQKYLLSDKFVIMFSGNLTYGGDIDTIIEAMTVLRDEKDIKFIIISEGARFEEFRTICKNRGLDNVVFLPYQKRDDLSFSLSAADVHLVTNKHGLEGIREPCKTYGILAVGRPFILIGNTKCVAADIARKHQVGIVVEERDVSHLVSTIRIVKSCRGEWLKKGRICREIFEKEYDAIYAINSFESVLLKACKSHTSTNNLQESNCPVESAVRIVPGNKNS